MADDGEGAYVVDDGGGYEEEGKDEEDESEGEGEGEDEDEEEDDDGGGGGGGGSSSAIAGGSSAAQLHVCTQCTSAFPDAYKLKRHERNVHLDFRAHPCDECTSAFKTVSFFFFVVVVFFFSGALWHAARGHSHFFVHLPCSLLLLPIGDFAGQPRQVRAPPNEAV